MFHIWHYFPHRDKLSSRYMKILVSNDDGIAAEGLWQLVRELRTIAPVAVVAPDRERSAIGTAVTLRQLLRVKKVNSMFPEVEAYSVEGTPGDCVILALGKLFQNDIGLVVSGINPGPNVGDDVLISGTVAAALQGYLRGLPALAVSLDSRDSNDFEVAAKVATVIAQRIMKNNQRKNVFLNINVPHLPLEKIKGVRITRLGSKSHIDSVMEGYDGKEACYWLVRQRLDTETDKKTDIWAIEQGNISITALHTGLLSRLSADNDLSANLLQELRGL